MRILIGNHWLKKLGGSETFTYTMCGELVKRGHDVDFYTNVEGFVSEKMKKDFRIDNKLKDSYDLILASHHTTVDKLKGRGKIVQTCHGTIPKLEQPSENADVLIPVSEEVKGHIKKLGFKSGPVILNGIDCIRFDSFNPVRKKLKTVLSLVHSDEANKTIKRACQHAGVKLYTINKYKHQVFDMPRIINKADLVISLGRGAYEAMACGRPVIVFDKRPYQEGMADGFLDVATYFEAVKCNLSGRKFKKQLGPKKLLEEFKKYDSYYGQVMRGLALDEHNIENQIDKYLKL